MYATHPGHKNGLPPAGERASFPKKFWAHPEQRPSPWPTHSPAFTPCTSPETLAACGGIPRARCGAVALLASLEVSPIFGGNRSLNLFLAHNCEKEHTERSIFPKQFSPPCTPNSPFLKMVPNEKCVNSWVEDCQKSVPLFHGNNLLGRGPGCSLWGENVGRNRWTPPCIAGIQPVGNTSSPTPFD